jgi:hypothetical protein
VFSTKKPNQLSNFQIKIATKFISTFYRFPGLMLAFNLQCIRMPEKKMKEKILICVTVTISKATK